MKKRPFAKLSGRAWLVIGVFAVLFVLAVVQSLNTDTTTPQEAAERLRATARAGAETTGAPVVNAADPSINQTPVVPTATSPPPTATAVPTATLSPTAPPPTLTAAETITAAVTDALGRGNRDVDRVTGVFLEGDVVTVRWAINDNFGANLIAASARHDIRDILEAIDATAVPYSRVLVLGSFSLSDSLGNVQETVVVQAEYSAATVERINFDNFNPDNVYVVADASDVHPELQQ